MSWLIYALGGGWGHLMRALAFGRIAALHRPVTILSNSPYTANLLNYAAKEALLPIVAGCYIQVISPAASFTQTCDRVRQIVSRMTYDCLIIDTFPRGLGGELADILPKIKSIPRILVHRDINPNYVRAKDLQRFVAEYFNLIFIPGETGELAFSQLPQVQHTAPWLIRSADELPTRSHARTLLHLNLLKAVTSPASLTPLVLIYAAGRAEELAFYGQLTQELVNSRSDITVRCLSAHCPEHCPPELWVFHWPGIECLPAANVVIGGAGYNTFYECMAVGVPLVAFAFERHYDRQGIRVKRWCEHQPLPPVRLVKSMEEAKLAVNEFLQLRPYQPPNLMNGAIAAVRFIEDLPQRTGNWQ